jgi:hypothetical protein
MFQFSSLMGIRIITTNYKAKNVYHPSMNCVYAPLGSISAELCKFHKYLNSKGLQFFERPCILFVFKLRCKNV